jgi:hypothetical protein
VAMDGPFGMAKDWPFICHSVMHQQGVDGRVQNIEVSRSRSLGCIDCFLRAVTYSKDFGLVMIF